MVQIEQYNATDKRQLHSRERFWIEQLKSDLHTFIPALDDRRAFGLRYSRSEKGELKAQQYRKKHQQYIRTQRAGYRAHNSERPKEEQRENHNCECGEKYTRSSKARHLKTLKHKFWQSTYDFIHS